MNGKYIAAIVIAGCIAIAVVSVADSCNNGSFEARNSGFDSPEERSRGFDKVGE